MKTLRDVLQKTGLSYPTLVKYTGLGLIPKPQRVWRGRKGSESWYPDDVIDAINRIKEEQKAGLTLRQIDENRKVGRAMNAYVELASLYPGYAIVDGSIKEIKSESEDTVVVEVRLRKMKKR